ncbi:hypothetical protein SAY87_011609 [Trapa incisa]|uniref:Uncharacterized protein n=1 Tax=Trapa incisa TaxID=236973 RepID=A0AAN7JIW2_9MYRT|nr:hypothetical protein SAY87_011609 [Trapa incisa]
MRDTRCVERVPLPLLVLSLKGKKGKHEKEFSLVICFVCTLIMLYLPSLHLCTSLLSRDIHTFLSASLLPAPNSRVTHPPPFLATPHPEAPAADDLRLLALLPGFLILPSSCIWPVQFFLALAGPGSVERLGGWTTPFLLQN